MKINPYFLIILATAIWGTSGPFVKLLALPPTTLSFFRMGIPTIVLFVVFRIQGHQLFQGDIKWMLIASVLNALRMFFYFSGYIYTSIGNAVLMLYTWPIFAAIFGFLILGEALTSRKVLLLFIAFGGILLVSLQYGFSVSSEDVLGMASMIFAGMLYAITVVIFKKESTKFTRNETIFYQNLIGTFIFLPFLFINDPLPSTLRLAGASFYGFWIGILGFGLFFTALKKTTASTASFLSYFEVPFAILYGFFFFEESITWNMILGGALIIGSSAFIQRKE